MERRDNPVLVCSTSVTRIVRITSATRNGMMAIETRATLMIDMATDRLAPTVPHRSLSVPRCCCQLRFAVDPRMQ